jgi:hypothetical protein
LTNNETALIAALIGAAAGAGGATLGPWLVRRSSRPDRVAAYLESIAETLRRMIENFKVDVIPHEHGRRLKSMLKDFEKRTRGVLRSDTESQLARLTDLIECAEIHDRQIGFRSTGNDIDDDDGINYDEHDRSRPGAMTSAGWILLATQAIGELQGAADRIRIY